MRRSLKLRRRAGTLAALIALALSGLLMPGQAAAPAAAATALPPVSAHRAAAAATPDYRRACAAPTRSRRASCLVLVRTNVAARTQRSLGPDTPPSGVGYGPASLQNAYVLPSANAGSGQTVAIVDAYDDPNAAADLATYRSDWGLPACTTANGCFSKVNQNGQASPLPPPSGSTGWATEESLDIDMVSAICPNCHIVLVEANSNNSGDLYAAENAAVAAGAKFVSNSWASCEYSGETQDDSQFFNHPGVAITAASGDWGYLDQGIGCGTPSYPAASPDVVAVGGTSLTQDSSVPRGWAETTWSGTGSGCSGYEPKPSWQNDSGCANRTGNDVAAVADPNTGVAVYDTYDQGGWLEVGGTSVATPVIASIYALVGAPAPNTYPASYLYAHTGALNDVTSGADGTCSPAYLCTAGPGYDGPTGWGTPNGIAAFGAPAGNIITVVNPGGQAATQDVAFSLQVHALDSASGQTLTYAAAGLPAGLSIDSSTGLISGTPATTGSFPVTVTVTDTTGASGTASFAVTVASPVSFTGPGPQSGYAGQPALVQATASDAVAGRTISYSASGLPGGVSIGPSTGLISGLPTTGYHLVTVTGTDSAGRTGTQTFVWDVAPAQVSGRTGPVTLPASRACLDDRGGGTANGNPIDTSKCQHGASWQAWTAEPDGTLRVLGKCLNVAGGGTASGTLVQLWSCRGTAAQQWRIASYGELVNPASGKCLTSPGALGTQLDIQSCTAGTGQRWTAPAGPVVSGVTGLCADSGEGTSGHLQVWSCGATAAQAWTVQPDGTIRVGGKCLNVAGGGTASGTSVDLATCGTTAGQQWRTGADATVVNPHSGKCLDDPGDSSTTGTRPVINTCTPATGELWHIE
jgi:hypothetical protein